MKIFTVVSFMLIVLFGLSFNFHFLYLFHSSRKQKDKLNIEHWYTVQMLNTTFQSAGHILQ